MKREKALLLLEEALTIEEVPNFTNLEDLRIMIDNLNFDDKIKKELRKKLDTLIIASRKHAKTYTELIKYVAKTKKQQF